MGLLLLAAAPRANANTYLFSFTGAQALAALEASQGTQVYQRSAYFELFVQPDPLQVSSYTYSSYSGPTPNATDAWDTGTITDPSNPLLGYDPDAPCLANCTFIRFGKPYAQTPDVAVLTGAGFFEGVGWGDAAPSPYGWGAASSINSFVSPSAVFQFGINTNDNLTGNIKIIGWASALVSGLPNTWGGTTKDDQGLYFEITAAPSSGVPEPGSFFLVLVPAAGLLIRRSCLRRSRQSR